MCLFTEYIRPDELLGALLDRHFRRNSHGTHSKWVYDKVTIMYGRYM
jgi:hypothetical protein